MPRVVSTPPPKCVTVVAREKGEMKFCCEGDAVGRALESNLASYGMERVSHKGIEGILGNGFPHEN